ncbi:HNH endonuclease [Sphingobacterium thalpophilum]|uniref:Uncharacterized protein n=1 Tax=Sphingobacterium thalpophilum TaxID=259 RepID=A0A4U9VRZ9_9SPHI|nr:hypothetical protein [Sphingobacterium thalpophilum]VTR49147.1 Uncharacterised protein [Sphingobacterium thalpophilum]
MIFLNNISDSIKSAHWKYFKSSDGFANLIKLSQDTTIPLAEKNYFLRLTDESLLQKIIIGNPEQLREEIKYYQMVFLKQNPILKFHQTFLACLSYSEDIYPKINRLAEKKEGVSTVLKNRKFYYNRFLYIINKLQDTSLEIGIEKDKLTIGNIRLMYNNLQNFFEDNLNGLYNRIKSVFNYDDFIKEKEEWYAYTLTQQLGVNVCPYCNRNYIHTSINDHGKTRAELDHFYPKSKYPFLSISLYNLIPSCHVCNSNLKKARDFYIEKHVHPYEDNYLNDFRFEIVYLDDSINNVVPDEENFNIELIALSSEDDKIKLINNSNQTFQIAQLHNFHKDIAQELLVRSIYYNKTKILELQKILGVESGIDDEFLKRVIIGNYGDIGSFGKRPLAKYSYDILSKTDLKKNLDL